MTVPLLDATKIMNEASAEYKKVAIQNVCKERNTLYKELAATNALKTMQSKSKVLAQMMRKENQWEQAEMKRNYFPKKGQQKQRVDCIQYLQGETKVEVCKPKAVLTACQRDIKDKYSETKTTLLKSREMH